MILKLSVDELDDLLVEPKKELLATLISAFIVSGSVVADGFA